MAEVSCKFRNIVGSKKCAVSSPRIVSLEIGNETPGGASESVFQKVFLNDQAFHNDVKNESNLNFGFDKQSDKNFLIHSQSLSASTSDERPSDKIKSNDKSDIDLDLLHLLNSADLKQAKDSGSENFNPKKATFDDKMKITSDVEVNDGLLDIFSSIAHDIREKEESETTFVFCQRKNASECEIDLLNFEFAKNECADSLSSNNTSLKIEGNLSDLLSSINIEDSDVTKVGNLNSISMCNSKIANKSEVINELPLADLSDLLSSIDLGDANDNKIGGCNKGKICNKNDSETKNESYLSDLLSSINVDKANKPSPTVLNGKPLSSDGLNFYCKGTNGISDSLNDFIFDIESNSTSSNSCASSYSEKNNNSPRFSSTKNDLTSKESESDSGFNSFDSVDKGFSFFDYSSDNQFSFNALLTKKSNACTAVKHCDSKDARNDDEEMSMSDLMTIVSPEFKNPVLATLNKNEKLGDSLNKGRSSMQDLIKCSNDESKNISNNPVDYDEKLKNCDDGRITNNVQSAMVRIAGARSNTLSKNYDVPNNKSYLVDDDNDEITNENDQNTFIDLRGCVKSTKHHFTPTSPVKQLESQSSECFSPNKVLFYCEDKSPTDLSQNRSNSFEFSDAVPRKKPRVNTKQTMFSKALACKPKKDHSLLQKVAIIKNELLNNIINRPVFIDCEVPQAIVESVLQSDKCIVSNVERKSFGLDVPCELQ